MALAQPDKYKNWLEWGTALLIDLSKTLDRAQRRDADFEPPVTTPTSGSRIILRDTNGVRYAVTVNTSGVLVVTAL